MTIMYFAWLRQKIGKSEEKIVLPENVRTVGELIAHLCAQGGGYADALSNMTRLRAAVNQEHAALDAKIGPDDEVALFPPVTGG